MKTTAQPHHGGWSRWAALAVIVASSAVGCSRPGTPAAPTPTGWSNSATPTTTPAPAQSPEPSAADQLAEFLTKAQRMDGRLRDTAALINTGIDAQTMTFTATMIEAVNAIDPRTVVPAIPAGMPGKLRNQVYLLFSELASRRYAFNPILETQPGQPIARDSQDGKRVLEGLSHGSRPAARFAADLAATRTLARSEPPFTVAPPDSRASAEVAIRTAYILLMNSGCGTSGGWVQTTAVPISWQQSDDGAGQRVDGTIGGIAFRTDYRPGRGWQVELNAC